MGYKAVLDVEMTGLGANDEIIQVSIIDDSENILFNRYFKPAVHTRWDEAAKLTGITPEKVKDCHPFEQDADEVAAILNGADSVIGYNIPVDLGKLRRFGCRIREDLPSEDVMVRFAPIYGDWSGMYGEYRYKSLGECAKYFGYEFRAHDSLEDVKATLFCYRKVEEHLLTHLSKEQEDALSQLCFFRYSLGEDAAKAVFSTYSADHDELLRILDTSRQDSPVKDCLLRAGLPAWEWEDEGQPVPQDDEEFENSPFSFEGTDYPPCTDWEDPVYDRKREAGLERVRQLIGSWNRCLSSYLSAINDRYGTDYA